MMDYVKSKKIAAQYDLEDFQARPENRRDR